MMLTDTSGNSQTQYTYGPFGSTLTSGASNDNPYKFGGREADPVAPGMYYLRARFLDSGLSRFVSRDPAGFQGSGHLYNYAGNAPTMATDPTGEDLYQAGYLIGFTYGYLVGFGYGLEASVDPFASNSWLFGGLTTFSDYRVADAAYTDLSGEALSGLQRFGVAWFIAKSLLMANADAYLTAEADAEAMGTNLESVANGGSPTAGLPPPVSITKILRDMLPVAPTGLPSLPGGVPSLPTAPPYPGGSGGT